MEARVWGGGGGGGGKVGRVRERWEVEGNIHHHFIGLLRMFTLKKCECSRLGWCLLVRLRGGGGREGGGGRGREDGGREEEGKGGERKGGEGKGEGEDRWRASLYRAARDVYFEKMWLFKPEMVFFGEGKGGWGGGRRRWGEGGKGGGGERGKVVGGGKGERWQVEGKGKGGRWRASLHRVARDVYFEEICLFKPGLVVHHSSPV